MGAAIGTQVSIGTAEETTYGTPVTPNRFHELLSESLGRRNRILTSNGLRTGTRNLRRGSRRVLSARDGGGDVLMEVATTGFSRWFKHMLGSTPTVVQQGVTAAYLHTHEMGVLLGKSLTVQKVLRDEAGTVISPFTLHGTKILGWEFSISVDQILQLRLTLDAEDVDTSTATAVPTYGNVKLFHFAQGSLRVAGSTVANVLSANVGGTNNLKIDRYYLGSNGLKAEPTDNDFPTIQGRLSAEYLDNATIYDRFAADTAVALVLEFIGPNIAAGEPEQLTITVPEIRFTGETPQVGGPQVVVQDVPFEGLYDGTNAGVKIEYQTTDAAA